MDRLLLGCILGLGAGVIVVLLMLPMPFPDKRRALTAAFCSRFAVGFVAANVALPFHAALAGALVGLLISVPDAVLTRAYVPILVVGTALGALSGLAAQAWGAALGAG